MPSVRSNVATGVTLGMSRIIGDTAIVVLSLSRSHGKPDEPMRERGRAFLIKTQQPDGSWVETTRPPGSESYAQRVSTSAWATLALLATAPNPR